MFPSLLLSWFTVFKSYGLVIYDLDRLVLRSVGHLYRRKRLSQYLEISVFVLHNSVHSGISEIGKFRLEKELIKVGPLLFKVLALKIDVQRAFTRASCRNIKSFSIGIKHNKNK